MLSSFPSPSASQNLIAVNKSLEKEMNEMLNLARAHRVINQVCYLVNLAKYFGGGSRNAILLLLLFLMLFPLCCTCVRAREAYNSLPEMNYIFFP